MFFFRARRLSVLPEYTTPSPSFVCDDPAPLIDELVPIPRSYGLSTPPLRPFCPLLVRSSASVPHAPAAFPLLSMIPLSFLSPFPGHSLSSSSLEPEPSPSHSILGILQGFKVDSHAPPNPALMLALRSHTPIYSRFYPVFISLSSRLSYILTPETDGMIILLPLPRAF